MEEGGREGEREGERGGEGGREGEVQKAATEVINVPRAHVHNYIQHKYLIYTDVYMYTRSFVLSFSFSLFFFH